MQTLKFAVACYLLTYIGRILVSSRVEFKIFCLWSVSVRYWSFLKERLFKGIVSPDKIRSATATKLYLIYIIYRIAVQFGFSAILLRIGVSRLVSNFSGDFLLGYVYGVCLLFFKFNFLRFKSLCRLRNQENFNLPVFATQKVNTSRLIKPKK